MIYKLTPLHSEWPKLHRVLAILSAIGLWRKTLQKERKLVTQWATIAHLSSSMDLFGSQGHGWQILINDPWDVTSLDPREWIYVRYHSILPLLHF